MAFVYDCTAWPVDLIDATIVECASNSSLTGTDLNTVPQAELFSDNKTSIDLSSNALVGNITSWSSATSLQILRLQDNALTGTLPEQAPGFLSTLELLDLSNNDFTGPVPAYFSQFTALQSLNLSGNAFEGCVPCPPLLDCAVNGRLVGMQSSGARLEFCSPLPPPPLLTTSSPTSGGNSSAFPAAGRGSDTFATSAEFAVVSAALLGTLGFLLVYCTMTAAFVRRKRFMRRIIAGGGDHDGAVVVVSPASATTVPRVNSKVQQRHTNSREGSSANNNNNNNNPRPGALSFDGREGWRSETELRTSARGLTINNNNNRG